MRHKGELGNYSINLETKKEREQEGCFKINNYVIKVLRMRHKGYLINYMISCSEKGR